MAKTVRILCDHCGGDITTTGKMPAFRLRLAAEALEHAVNVIHAVNVHPPIKEDAYFCNLFCLGGWAANKEQTTGGVK